MTSTYVKVNGRELVMNGVDVSDTHKGNPFMPTLTTIAMTLTTTQRSLFMSTITDPFFDHTIGHSR